MFIDNINICENNKNNELIGTSRKYQESLYKVRT